jgi:hypothetical protein
MATPALSQNCFTDLAPDQQNFNIYESLKQIAGFDIPTYDQIDIAYYGTTNNIATVQYLFDGVPVATLNLFYSVNPPIVNDANLTTVTVTYP